MSRTGSSGGLEGADAPHGPSRERPLTVGQLLAEARRVLRGAIASVWVAAEVDSLHFHRSSGHYYFCLKDPRAQVRAVMWKSDAKALRFELEQGQSLICRGHFDVYDREGRFQFIVTHAEPAGVGADAVAREQLKQRLAAEGLFDPARKRPLPMVPRSIGLVTSKSGAAVRDVIRAVQRRFPVPILVADCRVQGPDAPASIARALTLIAGTEVDVVIVGRGGGGATDLAAFDDEIVVRAVAACPVPIISAVGHEIDVSLTDLCADVRAATPTMAGEMAVPVWSDLYDQLTAIERRLARELEHAVRSARQELIELLARAERRFDGTRTARRHALADLGRRLTIAHPRARLGKNRHEVDLLLGRAHVATAAALERRHRSLDEAERRLQRRHPGTLLLGRRGALAGLESRAAAATTRALDRRRRQFATLVGQLEAFSPLAVLERGYAIASRAGHVVRRASEVSVGDVVTVRVAVGELDCRVAGVRTEELS